MNGGRFEFDDGGTYCGGWEDGKAYGYGVCSGPKNRGEYAGAYHYGFEVSGVYTWPAGHTYSGQWQNGMRHGLGIERYGKWVYRGEWTQSLKGRYGQRYSNTSQARYEGTWQNGFHDGLGTETYADGGTYQGQWQRGVRHGYGIRRSAQYGVAAMFRSRMRNNISLTSLRSDCDDENNDTGKKNQEEQEAGRGGFVLRTRSEVPAKRRRSLSERSLAVKRTILSGLRITKQRSTGDIHQRVVNNTGSLRSSGSTMSCISDDFDHRVGREHFVVPQDEHIEPNTVEIYKGEWKSDKRSGFGIGERSDGLRYEGEWFNNKKWGYGITSFKDGTKEEGRYKNNVLVCSSKKKGLMFVRSSRMRERIDDAVREAHKAALSAEQKADIAASRTITAREKAEEAEFAARQAQEDANTARLTAKQFLPGYKLPVTADTLRVKLQPNHVSFENTSTASPMKQASADSNYTDDSLSSSHGANINGGPNYMMHQSMSTLNTPSFMPQSQSSSPAANTQASRLKYNADEGLPIPAPHQRSRHITDDQPQQSVQFMDRVNSSGSNLEYSSPQSASLPKPLGSGSHEAMTTEFNELGNNIYGKTINPSLPSTSRSYPSEVSPTPEPQRPMESSTPQKERRFVQPFNQLANTKQSSSRISLSDDHYDQYMMVASSNQSTLLRRNRPSLTRQPDAIHDAAQALNRRSTLASARDRKFDEAGTSKAEASGDSRGSLPNLNELEASEIYLRREEAARLASRQRQEIQRQLEEEELLKSNPLRYLFHPAFKAWLIRYRIPLLLILLNVSLVLLFYSIFIYGGKKKN